MGLGIGLGGFATGFQGGYQLGSTIKEDTRVDRNRRAVEAIDAGARSEFDDAVSSGTQQADGWDDFYAQYVVPKKTSELLKQGDLAGAEAWRSWAESDAARRGGKMFANGLVQAQSGNLEAALNSFIEAAKLKGYGADFKDARLTPLSEGGYRLEMSGPTGPFSKDFKSQDEVLQFGASFANPEAAFAASIASSQADAASQRKITEDLTVHEGKALIDSRYPDPPSTGDYTAAYKAAADALPLEADTWSPKKRSRWIDKEVQRILRLAGGAAGQEGAIEPGKPVNGGGGKAFGFNVNTGEVVDVDEASGGRGNAAAKGDALGPTQRPPPAGDAPVAEPTADLAAAAAPPLVIPQEPASSVGLGSVNTFEEGVSAAPARPEVAGITGNVEPVAGGGPPTPKRPPMVGRMRQLAAQAATLKPGSPEHTAIVDQINQLKQQLDAAAMSGF